MVSFLTLFAVTRLPKDHVAVHPDVFPLKDADLFKKISKLSRWIYYFQTLLLSYKQTGLFHMVTVLSALANSEITIDKSDHFSYTIVFSMIYSSFLPTFASQ